MNFAKKSFGVVLCLFAALLVAVNAAAAEKWAFAAVGDSRSNFSSFRNTLQMIGKSAQPGSDIGSPVEFVLGVGDMDPVSENFKIFQEILGKNGPVFMPVRGNHETAEDVAFIMQSILPAYGERIRPAPGKGVTYYIDWKNVRIIVIDQYTIRGPALGEPDAVGWVEGAIRSAPERSHVLIAFHEPNVPEKPTADPFWGMLLKNTDRVRAVLCGHTHKYLHRFIPDTFGGIHYINVGNAGQSNHSDGKQTLVSVSVEGERLRFRVFQAPDGTREFRPAEQWETKASPDK